MISDIEKDYKIPYGTTYWGIPIPREQSQEISKMAEVAGKMPHDVVNDLITQGLTCRRIHADRPAHIRTNRRKA